MGDAEYYTALLEQYYYGSNASKFQWLMSSTLHDNILSNPWRVGKL
jgi:hypothetical protein